MNKSQLIESVATTLEISKAEAGRTIDTVVEAIIAGTKADGECVIPGLGKLKIKETAARSGTSLGKTWTKEAGKKFVLSVSKEGKEAL